MMEYSLLKSLVIILESVVISQMKKGMDEQFSKNNSRPK